MINIKNIWIKIRKLFTSYSSTKTSGNITSVIIRILKYYKIKVTSTTVMEFLISHPEYPSLISICDFFDNINVSNCALKLNESDLLRLDFPFIAHINAHGGKVLLIYSINKSYIIYSDSLNNKKKIPLEEFLLKWDGIIIIIEPSESSGEINFDQKNKDEFIRKALVPLIILIFIMIGFEGIHSTNRFQHYHLFITGLIHILGFIFTLFLFLFEINIRFTFIEKFCHLSTNTDCNAIIKDRASKIFGILTWADLGIVYFAGGLINIFLFYTNNTFYLLKVLSISVLPYILFSVLYQRYKIKKWCPLCLSVQSILFIEFLFFTSTPITGDLTLTNIFTLLISFSIVLLIILLIKFLLIAENEKAQIYLKLLKLKRDPDIFKHKLSISEKIDIPSNQFAIFVGNIKSDIKISIFLSLYCSACAKIFKDLLILIKNNNKIKVQLIFYPAHDKFSTALLKTICSLMKADDQAKIISILEEWYNSNRKAIELLVDSSIQTFNKDYELMNDNHTNLYNLAKIIRVPRVYIDGIRLPEMYTFEDIKYFTNELTELQPNKVKNNNQSH